MNRKSTDEQLSSLPLPDADAAAHSAKLRAMIRDDIDDQGGRISFARFMELALYAPGLGYYTAGAHKFGEAGDFVTAPEISPLFSRCLALQCQQVLDQIEAADLLEFGAGSGVMASDVLLELERLDSLPQRYYILELSAELKQRQRNTLEERVPHLCDRITWLDEMPASFNGVMLANEVLDAMPVHRFCINSGKFMEQFVVVEDDRFVLQSGEPGSDQLTMHLSADDLSEGYCSEVNLAAEAWIATVAPVLKHGVLLVIDYGYPRSEYYHPQRNTGTLLCHYRHRAHADPFLYVGLQDITAHVDFTAIAETAVANGLAVAGYTTQAHFLMACGLDQLMADTDPNDTRARLALSSQIQKLTLPSEMGEVFKVMALSKQMDEPLRGFALRDFRNRL